MSSAGLVLICRSSKLRDVSRSWQEKEMFFAQLKVSRAENDLLQETLADSRESADVMHVMCT